MEPGHGRRRLDQLARGAVCARQSRAQRCGRTEDDIGEAEEREEGAASAEELPGPGAAGQDAEAVDDEREGDDEVDDGEAERTSARLRSVDALEHATSCRVDVEG